MIKEITHEYQSFLNRNKTLTDFKSSFLIDCTTTYCGDLNDLIQRAKEFFLTVTSRTNTRTGATEYELSDKEGYAGLIELPEKADDLEFMGGKYIMIVVHSTKSA